MLNATPEELIDLSDYLYELAAQTRIAADYAPEDLPNEMALRTQMLSASDHLKDAAGSPSACSCTVEPELSLGLVDS